jgi:hypothetical protein
MAGGQVPLVGQEANQLVIEIVRRFLKVMREKVKGQPLC